MACQRCHKKVSNKERITCQGYCGTSFHAICANVDGPLQEQLAQDNKNVFWMCDGCAGLFSNSHFRTLLTNYDEKSSALPAAFQSMQSEIEKLQTAVSDLAAKVEDKPNIPTPFATPNLWPNWNRTNTPFGSLKRRRANDGTSSIPASNVGTKTTGGIRTVQLDHRDDNSNLLWIYLTAFHPTTSESQIASLVTECLNLTSVSPKVVKLVPKGKDLNSMEFISFKVGIPDQLKEKALASDTWPENIRFREFDDQRSKNGPKIVSLLPTAVQEDKPPSAKKTAPRMDV